MTQAKSTIDLNPSWLAQLSCEFEQDYMRQLKDFLQREEAESKVIYPRCSHIFNAFNATQFDQVKVVILGQDPYHGPNQAHGLSFSVPEGVRVPPSLINIYKELMADIGMEKPSHGNLSAWAAQGVLLLNSVLTVEHQQAASHKNQGWERFTDAVVAKLAAQRENVVFMLWGSYAQAKGRSIDASKHLVLKAPHPSPLSAHRGFLGCKHFSQANQYLLAHGQQAVEWAID